MTPDVKAQCCAVAEVAPGSEKGTIVEHAAGFADEWYSTNPMPMGSPAASERHHLACRNFVANQVRIKLGLFSMMSLFASLLSICRTVWNWRKTVPVEQAPAE